MSDKICKNCGSYTIKSSTEIGGLVTSNYGYCKLKNKPVDFWNSCNTVDSRNQGNNTKIS